MTVRDNPARRRYEIFDGDTRVGMVAYRTSEGRIEFTHTEIDPAFEGRGFARRLVTEALADARRRALAVLPSCPYVRDVIARGAADHLDLVPPEERERFGLPRAAG